MFTPRFELRGFIPSEHNGRIRVINALLQALITQNVVYLESNSAPLLYSSGVRYEFEPPDSDDWQDIAQTLYLGYGDCEDLAAYRIAELIRSGETSAKPHILTRLLPGNVTLYHIQVMRGDGSIEDPSARLGMPPV